MIKLNTVCFEFSFCFFRLKSYIVQVVFYTSKFYFLHFVYFNIIFRPLHIEDCVCVDKFKMDQVIRNLISNALKFTPRGGSVNVTVRKFFYGFLFFSDFIYFILFYFYFFEFFSYFNFACLFICTEYYSSL